MTPRCQNYRHVIDALDTKHPAPESAVAQDFGTWQARRPDFRQDKSGPAPELALVTGPSPHHSTQPRSEMP